MASAHWRPLAVRCRLVASDAPSISASRFFLRIVYADRARRTTSGQSTPYSTDITFHSFPMVPFPRIYYHISIFLRFPSASSVATPTALSARPSLPKTALNSFSVHADRLTTFSVELLNKGRTTRPIFTGRPPTTIKGGTFFSERQSLFRKKRRQS